MLPLPGTPSSSWRRTRAHLRLKFEGADAKVCLAFWLFGLINNILYVVILTAALDLVGPLIPKATILLCSIIPGLTTKILVPYFIDRIAYSLRIWILAALSICGMLAVALSSASTEASSITAKIVGIVLANISSGAGEVNFLSLTHYYGRFSLAAWGSGTGGAGLVGAAAYALATNELNISPQHALLSTALLPVVMVLSYFILLTRDPLRAAMRDKAALQSSRIAHDSVDNPPESAGLLEPAMHQSQLPTRTGWLEEASKDFRYKLSRATSLVVPYMVPLFLVYLAEYTINQGIAPTLLFPLEESPFHRYRAFYPTYGALYQAGVFVSRSSLALFQVRALYIPSILQILNLVALTAHAIHPYIPSVYFVFAIILWEGLLGGLVYVSTYARVREEVKEEDREFSLGAISVADSAGIFVAGLVGVGLETALCNWQTEHGRDWCKRL